MSKFSLPSFLSAIVLLFFSVTIIPVNQSFAQDEIIPGEIQHHVRNDEIIWDWFSYVPENLNKNENGYIMAWANSGGYEAYDEVGENRYRAI